MAIAGPGAVKQTLENPKPLLDGASEFEYVTIYNPLSDDFAVQVAQDIPVNAPIEIRKGTGSVQNERDLTTVYGVALKNTDHTAKKYIYNNAIILSGQTMNFKGNEAQVVVKQLVDEILQREGKTRLMADPTLRNEIEARIIKNRNSVQSLMESNIQSQAQQINQAVNKSNEASNDAFPGLDQTTTSDTQVAEGTPSTDSQGDAPAKRSPGRPKQS